MQFVRRAVDFVKFVRTEIGHSILLYLNVVVVRVGSGGPSNSTTHWTWPRANITYVDPVRVYSFIHKGKYYITSI